MHLAEGATSHGEAVATDVFLNIAEDGLVRGRGARIGDHEETKRYTPEALDRAASLRLWPQAMTMVAAMHRRQGALEPCDRFLRAASEMLNGTPLSGMRESASDLYAELPRLGRVKRLTAYAALDWQVRSHLPVWLELAHRLGLENAQQRWDAVRTLSLIDGPDRCGEACNVLRLHGFNQHRIDYAGTALIERLMARSDDKRFLAIATPRSWASSASGVVYDIVSRAGGEAATDLAVDRRWDADTAQLRFASGRKEWMALWLGATCDAADGAASHPWPSTWDAVSLALWGAVDAVVQTVALRSIQEFEVADPRVAIRVVTDDCLDSISRSGPPF